MAYEAIWEVAFNLKKIVVKPNEKKSKTFYMAISIQKKFRFYTFKFIDTFKLSLKV